MKKFTDKLKLKAINLVLKKNYSMHEAARQCNMTYPYLRTLILKYQETGIEGIISKKRKYTGEFKVNVVEYMHTNHLSLVDAAAKFSVSNHAAIWKWERIYYEEGPQALLEERRGGRKNGMDKKKKLPKQTEEDLIAEVQRLRMENDYLKKLNALIQEKEKLKKKTK